MRKLSKTLLTIMAMVAIAVACTTTNTGYRFDWDKLPPKTRATLAMDIYNQEYQNYKLQALAPDLTDHERDVLRKKKEALVQLHDVIQLYNGYIMKGEVPPDLLEKKLVEALNAILDAV